jgi:hypothetical protein
MIQRRLVSLIGVTSCLFAAPLFAQTQDGAALKSGDDPFEARGRRGFELMVQPGYGSAGQSSPIVYRTAPLVALTAPPGDVFSGDGAPYGSGFSGQASAGYRMLPFLSAGLYGELRNQSADAPNDGTEELSRSAWGLGTYLRAYLPVHARFDPWASVGVGYVRDQQSYRRSFVAGQPAVDVALTHHGVAVPLAIGVDYRLLPELAVGPSFRYAPVLAAGGCFELTASSPFGAVGNKHCSDAQDNQRIVEAKSYGAWSAGLDLRMTL